MWSPCRSYLLAWLVPAIHLSDESGVPTTLMGVDIRSTKDENGKPLDGIAFHPYYTVKDIVGVVVFPVCVLHCWGGGGGSCSSSGKWVVSSWEKPNF